ncbi:hypothetical protein JCM9279_001417 [Rhodotorula babjevae]
MSLSRRSSFALDDDDELSILPPLPEKEPIWRRATIHLSPNLATDRGRYSALEQRERLARPRPASYLELNMAAPQEGEDGDGRGERELPSAPRRRPVAAACWLLGALLVGATAATFYRPFRLDHPLALAVHQPRPVCPDPRLALPPSLLDAEHRSAPINLPSSSPDFSLALVHDTRTCNAFELTISRTDPLRCAEMESGHNEPSKDPKLDAWIKTHLGPDTFNVQVDGAERRAEMVPTEYLGDCEYLFTFRLNNPGRLWLNVSLLYEDYEGFKEIDAEKGSRPRPRLLMQPLVARPLELNLCDDACRPYIPPRLGEPAAPPYGLPISTDDKEAQIAGRPDCSTLDPLRTPLGHWVPSNPHDLVYPPLPVPLKHSRPMAGLYTFVPSLCTWDHDGLRFRDHASCVEEPHAVFFLGDSHARAIFDIAKHRLGGNDSVEDKSMKANSKSGTVDNLYLEFRWDPFLKADVSCDTIRNFDSFAVSTGSHEACWNCPSTASWLSSMNAFFLTWPDRVAACRAGHPSPSSSSRPTKPPRFFFLNIPATHPQLHNHDCRTGPRIAYWNEKATELARKRGWEVVDTHQYTQAGQIDSVYGDGIHYLGLDSAEPVVDDFLSRLGICGKDGGRRRASGEWISG